MHREVGSTHSKCASKWVGTRMWRSYIYTSSKVDSNDAFTVNGWERERGRMNIKHCKAVE